MANIFLKTWVLIFLLLLTISSVTKNKMVGCAAPNCSRNTRKKNNHYPFPVNKKRGLQWLINCRRDKLKPSTESKLYKVGLSNAMVYNYA